MISFPVRSWLWGIAFLLSQKRTQVRIDGLDSAIWDDDDSAILDETKVSRLYTRRIHGEVKWAWCLQTDPALPRNTGIADALDDAKAAFKKRYEEVKRRK